MNREVHRRDGLTTDRAEAIIDKIAAAIRQLPAATQISIELELGL